MGSVSPALGVSQYTWILIYCNTKHNYITVSRYKGCILLPVFSVTFCKYYFSYHLLMFYKTLIRFLVSSEMLNLSHKNLETILVPLKFMCSFGLFFLVTIFHGNILQYGCHVLQYLTIECHFLSVHDQYEWIWIWAKFRESH
jgi:hypothetical protein